jgi:RHS repeat-associated protein
MIGATAPHTAGALVVPAVAYLYDGIDRVTRMERSDGSFVERQYATRETLVPGQQHWLGGIDCTSSILPCVVGVELTVDEEGKRDVQISDHRGLVLRNIDGENVDTTTRSSNYACGAFNRLKTTSDSAGHVTSFTHDAHGRRTAHVDPDIGQTLYFYNGYDELRTSIDPSQQRLFDYDSLGRIASILDASGLTTWVYDQGANGLGQLSEMSSPATAENPAGQHVRYTYEPIATPNRGLLERLDYVIDGVSYPITFSYDDLGRTDRINYPDRGSGPPIAAKYQYDTSGVLTGVDEVGGAATRQLWRMTEAFQGHLTQEEVFGNGATTTYSYDAQRRWLDSIGTTLEGETIQSIGFTHYQNGQVHLRTTGGTFRLHTYDQLNRLASTGFTTTFAYDAAGNLTRQGDKNLTYQTARPHHLDTVDDNTYQYDLHGNVRRRAGPDIPGSLQVIDYTPFDLPKAITTGQGASEKTTRFEYTADEERLVRRDEATTRHFVTDLYQRLIDNNGSTTLEERFQLYAGDRPIGEIVRKNGTDETLYFHPDELGSVSTLSNDAGASFEQRFGVFGELQSSADPELTRAGYTGHQHERDLGLIDMRGRMFDPLAGRFLSADPVSQAPFWSQGLNRYSYVFNDPANNTDPSGFITVNDVGATLTAGFVIGGHLLAGGILAAQSGGIGGLVAYGVNLGSGAHTAHGLLNASAPVHRQVAGGPLGSLPGGVPQGLRMCDSGQCLAQNAGDPSGTGTSGTSGSSSDVPAQPGTAIPDEIGAAMFPAGRMLRLVGVLAKAARGAPWAGRMAQALWGLLQAGKASRGVILKGAEFFQGFLGRNAFDASTRQLGRFTEFAVSVPGKTGGSYTRWVKVVNQEGRTVRLHHDTFDKTGRFLHRGVKVPGPVRHVP